MEYNTLRLNNFFSEKNTYIKDGLYLFLSLTLNYLYTTLLVYKIMKFSIVTGASLILAIVINSASAEIAYFYCGRPYGRPCAIKGIEKECPAINGILGPQNCFSDDQKSSCTVCFIDSGWPDVDRLSDWCQQQNGMLRDTQESLGVPPFCENIDF
jgi:hypothetical protein